MRNLCEVDGVDAMHLFSDVIREYPYNWHEHIQAKSDGEWVDWPSINHLPSFTTDLAEPDIKYRRV